MNLINFAISSGVAIRFNNVLSMSFCFCSVETLLNMSVSTNDGTTQLTLILRLDNSIANDLVNPSRPALLAA